MPEIARELGVDAIVEGSIQRGGGRTRVLVQLIAANDAQLWSQAYDHEGADLLSIEAVPAREVRVHEVVPDLGLEHAVSGERARRARHQHGLDTELLGQENGMHRPRAAKGDHRELARVQPSADGDLPDQSGHPCVNDVEHALGEALLVQVEPAGEPAQRVRRHLWVQGHAAAQEIPRVDAAKADVRVCDRRLGASPSVARGTWLGARAARTHSQTARRLPRH